MLKVRNMISINTGRAIPNQFVIDEINDNYGNIDKEVFQSYDSTIIEIDYVHDVIAVHDDYNYSKTTGKYRNQFFADNWLPELATLKGLEEAIKAGKFNNYAVIRV